MMTWVSSVLQMDQLLGNRIANGVHRCNPSQLPITGDVHTGRANHLDRHPGDRGSDTITRNQGYLIAPLLLHSYQTLANPDLLVGLRQHADGVRMAPCHQVEMHEALAIDELDTGWADNRLHENRHLGSD
jgi:hypothetical protein